MSSQDWRKALKEGDLVLAASFSSEKQHIARLTHTKYDDNVGPWADKSYLLKTENHERDKAMWSGRALCGFTGRYYLHLYDHLWNEGRCATCHRRWKKQGSPGVKGWTDVPPIDATGWPLPFGWRDVPAVGHPWDVPPGGDIEAIRDQTGDVVGVHRTELRRWQRGFRIVRIVVVHDDDDRHMTRYHDADRPLNEQWSKAGAPEGCLKDAWRLMAIGGRP